MRHLRARPPVRGLALVVLAVLVAGFLAAFTYARRAVADQEGRLLKQRAGEAGVLLNGAVTQLQGATDALAAVVVATHGDTAAFLDAAGRDSAVAGGTSGVALVGRNLDGSSRVETVLYAGPRADPAQVVLATRALPLAGPTVADMVTVGGERWLLVVAANRPLVGSMESREPWLLLGRGLILTVLVTCLVEVLRRRRAYALALVDERTETLEQQTRSLGRDRERLAEAQRIA